MMKLVPLSIFVGLLALVAGCADIISNPPEPFVPKRDGVLLVDSSGVHGIDWSSSQVTIGPNPEGPWLIKADWIIDSTKTVTIQPGTEFIFDGLWWVDVQGRVIAEGSTVDPITFTTAFVDRDFGQWRGFKLRNPDSVGESVFKHCVFTYGAYFDIDTLSERGRDAQNYRGMLSIVNCSPTIERCVIYFNQNNGVFISGSESQPAVRFNIITENDASAVRADTLVDLDRIHVEYNNVSDNSSIAFLMGYDSTRWGVSTQLNSNLDSCDANFNIELPPLFTAPDLDDFSLQSCSPCIDAGPTGIDLDGDGTRADMGTVPYIQSAGELRGVVAGVLASGQTYRMSCHLRVDAGQILTIEPGVRIETTGYFNIEVFGRLLAQGTAESPIHVCPCQQVSQDRWGGLRVFQVDSLERRPGEWYQPSEFHYCEFVDYDRVDVHKPGVIFEGCKFERGFNYGVNVSTETKQAADSVAFHSCDFLDCGQYAIETVESPVSVRNCFIDRSKGRGISIVRGGDHVFVTNSIVQVCSTSAIVCRDFARPTLINNVFRKCGYYGIQLDNQCRPVLQNNIVTECYRFGIYATQQSIPYLDYNNFWGNYTEDGSNRNLSPDTISVRNGISSPPAFISANDLHLADGSPCIDTGNPDPIYNDANGTRNDMGAYGGPRGGSVGLSRLVNRELAAR